MGIAGRRGPDAGVPAGAECATDCLHLGRSKAGHDPFAGVLGFGIPVVGDRIQGGAGVVDGVGRLPERDESRGFGRQGGVAGGWGAGMSCPIVDGRGRGPVGIRSRWSGMLGGDSGRALGGHGGAGRDGACVGPRDRHFADAAAPERAARRCGGIQRGRGAVGGGCRRRGRQDLEPGADAGRDVPHSARRGLALCTAGHAAISRGDFGRRPLARNLHASGETFSDPDP